MSWQPIETAPRNGQYFYVSNADLETPILARWNQEAGCPVIYLAMDVQKFDEVSATCTHWMPIPAPPTN